MTGYQELEQRDAFRARVLLMSKSRSKYRLLHRGRPRGQPNCLPQTAGFHKRKLLLPCTALEAPTDVTKLAKWVPESVRSLGLAVV